MSPAVIKIAAIALAIKELWLLMGIPAFADTVISFLTVGAIPGTDRTLTPDEMYKLLIGVFVIFVLLVFRKEIIRLFKRRTSSQPTIEAVTPVGPPQMPLEHPLAKLGVGLVEANPPVSKATKAPRKPIAVHVPAFMLPAARLIKAKLAVGRHAAITTSVVVWDRIKVISRQAVVIIRLTGRTLFRVVLLIIIVIADAAVVAWRMAEPYIRKFDAFLEKKTHEFEFTRTLISIGSEMITTGRRWGKNIKAAFDEASTPKPRGDQ